MPQTSMAHQILKTSLSEKELGVYLKSQQPKALRQACFQLVTENQKGMTFPCVQDVNPASLQVGKIEITYSNLLNHFKNLNTKVA